MNLHALTLESVSVSHFNGEPKLRAFAVTSEGVRFEFVALTYLGKLAPTVEVYDYPKDWKGVARFVGYLPVSTGESLIAAMQAKAFARDLQTLADLRRCGDKETARYAERELYADGYRAPSKGGAVRVAAPVPRRCA